MPSPIAINYTTFFVFCNVKFYTYVNIDIFIKFTGVLTKSV